MKGASDIDNLSNAFAATNNPNRVNRVVGCIAFEIIAAVAAGTVLTKDTKTGLPNALCQQVCISAIPKLRRATLL
jgi:hypothetical protein